MEAEKSSSPLLTSMARWGQWFQRVLFMGEIVMKLLPPTPHFFSRKEEIASTRIRQKFSVIWFM